MAVQMTELDHIPGEELTHIPGEELTHIPDEELPHEPGLPLGYAPKWLLDELGLGHYYDPALTVDLNPLPPTVPHAPKTLPDPPPKKSQLPVPIVEHPNVKSQLPVPIEEPLAVASHLPVALPEPAAKKSQQPVAMPGVVGTEAARRALEPRSRPLRPAAGPTAPLMVVEWTLGDTALSSSQRILQSRFTVLEAPRSTQPRGLRRG